MKRIRIIVKTLLCVAAFTFSVGLDSYLVRAQKSGCNATQACSGLIWCTCGDSDCDGCFIPSGQGGCGTCRTQ